MKYACGFTVPCTNHFLRPRRPLEGGKPGGMRQVEYEVKDAVLVLHLSQGAAAAAPSGAAPAVPWVNLELVGCNPAGYLPPSATRGGLLLTEPEFSVPKLTKYVQVKHFSGTCYAYLPIVCLLFARVRSPS